MKQHHRRCHQPQRIDPDFAEDQYPAESHHSSSDRQAQRKTSQFCRQVQRALNLALAHGNAGDAIPNLFIEEVLPMPDCGHLLVQFLIPDGRPVAEAISALRNDAQRLRSEVAMAITRKRAPELSFVPALGQEEAEADA